MTEPATSTVAGVAGWKLIGGLAGLGAASAGLAAFVVMCLTLPRNSKEWRVALASTLIGSICGGSAFVRYFQIQSWIYDPFGVVAIAGVIFACGLPAWAIVRALFNYTEKRRNAGIDELRAELLGKK